MPLNPLRDVLLQSGLEAYRRPSPFRTEAEGALAGFTAARRDLAGQVRRGDLTPKVARQRAAELVEGLAVHLKARLDATVSVPGPFQGRLAEATRDRTRAREAGSAEVLQRETNRMLRSLLVEQQIVNRRAEFEGRSFVRSSPTSTPSPTLGGLLEFHAWAEQAGDDSAREWARRQLEAFRMLVFAPEDQRAIDRACDRPDRVNPRIVARYLETLRGSPAEALEAFAAEAVAARDANACIAAFALAREAPEGIEARWVRKVLDGLREFPDPALEALRTLEADASTSAREDAAAQVEDVIARARVEARLEGVDPLDEAELARQARMAATPVALADQPIGLAVNRRGATAEERAAIAAAGLHAPVA